jgi:putative phosphoribosyl transferase
MPYATSAIFLAAFETTGEEMFPDRISAGRLLARHLMHLRRKDPVVLALPRGGVPVALAVAEALDAPLDVILARKIAAPHQPELAIGAVADGAKPLVEVDAGSVEMLGVPPSDIAAEQERQWNEIRRHRALYRQSRRPLALDGRTVVIVDDGIATGATMRVAIAAARQHGAAEVVVATPVGPPETLVELRGLADAVICLETPAYFGGVGAHYGDFTQVTDAEVRAYLAARPVPVEEHDAKP